MTEQEQLAAETALASKNFPAPEAEGLQRRLSQRQLTMMAIGGAIGVGLFLGSSPDQLSQVLITCADTI